MAAPTLSWTLNTDRGTINFGRLVPFAGNSYAVNLAGGVVGQTYTIYLMDDAGMKCLAKSIYVDSAYRLELNGADLREEFLRDMHEMRSFHCVVRDTEKTVAEGDLSVQWNPLWTDTSTGEVYTMKGPKGDTGEPGRTGATGDQGKSAYQIAVDNGYVGTIAQWLESLKGQPGNTIIVKEVDASDVEGSLWHRIFVKKNSLNEWVPIVKQEGETFDPDSTAYVTRTTNQTIEGVKTFNTSPIIPTPGNDDNSTKAANTSWIRDFISTWWNSIKAAAVTFTGVVTGSAGFVGSLTGNVTGNVTGNADTATKASTADDVADLTDNSSKIANTKFVQSLFGVRRNYKVNEAQFHFGGGNTQTAKIYESASGVLSLGSSPATGTNGTQIATCAYVRGAYRFAWGQNGYTTPTGGSGAVTVSVPKPTANSQFIAFTNVGFSGTYGGNYYSVYDAGTSVTSENSSYWYVTCNFTKQNNLPMYVTAYITMFVIT